MSGPVLFEKYPDLWSGAPIEIPTKWDSNVALANLQSAVQANPNIDFLFTSSERPMQVSPTWRRPFGPSQDR